MTTRTAVDGRRKKGQMTLETLVDRSSGHVSGGGSDQERQDLEDKIAEIDGRIAENDYRTANIRAGYVYVISNVGSFGSGIVKIGLTRRLEPMDRVRELGDASVPFGFDVHTLFFSDDAVSVEAELHRRFARTRVNRVNLRREYFYATPADVKTALIEIAGNLLEFTEPAEAEQYHASESMRAAERASDTQLASAGSNWPSLPA